MLHFSGAYSRLWLYRPNRWHIESHILPRTDGSAQLRTSKASRTITKWNGQTLPHPQSIRRTLSESSCFPRILRTENTKHYGFWMFHILEHWCYIPSTVSYIVLKWNIIIEYIKLYDYDLISLPWKYNIFGMKNSRFSCSMLNTTSER